MRVQKSWGRKTPDISSIENVKNTVERLPFQFQDKVKKSYFENFAERGERESNLSILEINLRLNALGISLSDNDRRLAEIAKDRAEICNGLNVVRYVMGDCSIQVNNRGKTFSSTKRLKTGGVASTLRYVEELGIDLPSGKTDESRAARARDADWWMRRLRTLQIRAQETIAREFGVVHKKSNVYVSDSAVSRIEARRARSWEILKTMEAVNCDDESERLNMHDVAMKSIANPENRHNELMVRAAGFDAYSRRHAHVADFYTITTPSKYHAYHHFGKPNKKFKGATPREAQDYLVTLWARIRSKLKREEIQIYGLRIAEPHHDGTPHWHMLIYVKKAHRQQLRRIIRTYAMKEDNHELNSEKRRGARYDVEGINPVRGSGASYILKYIAKNIQGIKSEGQGGNSNEQDVKDYESDGLDSSATAGRVSVWASVWGIRQFQQIGGGSITVWRELRKLRGLEKGEVQGDLFDLWKSADSNAWESFIMLLGGADMPKSQQLAGLYKEIAPPEVRVCENTGEYFDLSLNKYGEERELILGVQSLNGILPTREKRWRIEKMQGVDTAPLGVL